MSTVQVSFHGSALIGGITNSTGCPQLAFRFKDVLNQLYVLVKSNDHHVYSALMSFQFGFCLTSGAQSVTPLRWFSRCFQPDVASLFTHL